MRIEGGNNPINSLSVDKDGRAAIFGTTQTEQQLAASLGDTYNVNTDEITLTNDAETPLFYLSNNLETRSFKITRVFKALMESTGGAGPARAYIYYNITGGTILSGAALPIANFNAGSAKTLAGNFRLGGTGVTFSGGDKVVRFLFPVDNVRLLTAFDHIVLPRGSNMLFTYQPPAGNTSQIVEAGCNIFLQEIDL